MIATSVQLKQRDSVQKNKRSITYPNFDSAIHPAPHSYKISIPQPHSSVDEPPSELEDEVTLAPQGESSSDFFKRK